MFLGRTSAEWRIHRAMPWEGRNCQWVKYSAKQKTVQVALLAE
eukprot:gene15226-21009_t